MSRRTLLAAIALAVAVTVAAVMVGACAAGIGPLREPPRATAFTTTGPWSSMVYLARTERGVVAVDLGWIGAEGELDDALRRLDADPDDVVAVFLTHSHRDHIAAWDALPDARFYLAEDELPYFHGGERHGGPVPWLVAAIDAAPRPDPGELDVRTFTGDTAIALGRDTMYAFPVPGHTPGSAAYLFRGVLFAGDAIAYTPLLGFHPAKRMYTVDVDRSRASLAALGRRLRARDARYVCTAHAKCTVPDSAFWADLVR